ncbi:MAG: C69 family dipeptidase [bacterium]|nr:C69 family dipeptidase [bacterium]
MRNKNKIKNKIFVVFVCCFVLNLQSLLFSCSMILAGKGATKDGSVLLAHNNDLPGHIASLIQIVPGRQHSTGEMIEFRNGLKIPQAPQTHRMLIMNCYYGFAEGDAKAINPFQVAIAGGASLKEDRNENARRLDPLIKGGVSGYIRYIALQRTKTARECVELIGKMYSTYGISYPSGVGVADADEVWYIEAGGGKCWVAQRVPDDSYLVAVNSYRIGNIDFNDKQNFITPPYLKSYAIEKGLWTPGENKKKKKPFNFAAIFGGNKKVMSRQPYYNARRVWRAQGLLSPSVKQDPASFTHPFTLKPDQKITIPRLISLMRDYYKGTPFDISRQKSHSPHAGERAIGVFNTVHADVIQLRGHLPTEIGAIMWGGLSSSLTTPYVPYYFGIGEIPSTYGNAGPSSDHRSAFWRFRALTILLEPRFTRLIGSILPVWENFETRLFSMQPTIEKVALELYKKDKARAKGFLTLYSNGLALKALEMAKELKTQLETTLAENSNK